MMDEEDAGVAGAVEREAEACGVSLRHRASGRLGIAPREDFNGEPAEEACCVSYPEEYAVLVRMAIHWTRELGEQGPDGPGDGDDASPRVLWLTAQLLSDHNAALYTCWQWRRDALRAQLGRLAGASAGPELASWCRDELQFARCIAESNQKNYQVCHHRQEVISMATRAVAAASSPADAAAIARGLCESEYAFAGAMLGADAKNYHVWQHRTWITTGFAGAHLGGDAYPQILRGELEFTARLLGQDGRNNSAFQYRSVVAGILRRLGQSEWVAEREAELRLEVAGRGARDGDLDGNASAARYFDVPSGCRGELQLAAAYRRRPSQHPFALLRAAIRHEACERNGGTL